MLASRHGVVEVEIADVGSHKLCPWGGDHTIEQKFNCEKLYGGGTIEKGVINSIPANRDTSTVFLFLLVEIIAHYSPVGDISPPIAG